MMALFYDTDASDWQNRVRSEIEDLKAVLETETKLSPYVQKHPQGESETSQSDVDVKIEDHPSSDLRTTQSRNGPVVHPFRWLGSPTQREALFTSLMYEEKWIAPLSGKDLKDVLRVRFPLHEHNARLKAAERRSEGTTPRVIWCERPYTTMPIFLVKCLIASELLPSASDSEIASLIYENFQKEGERYNLSSLKSQASGPIPYPGDNPNWGAKYKYPAKVEDLVKRVKQIAS